MFFFTFKTVQRIEARGHARLLDARRIQSLHESQNRQSILQQVRSSSFEKSRL